jgi:N-acetylglucosaminyldiphosphoundecaprenol N-acetyl-beta-D-mannosaminyltransferase
MLELCALAARRGWRNYFYGAAPQTLEALGARLGERFPGLRVAGSLSPPFRPLSEEESRRTVEAINRARPDIVWVGLSTPKQERWMARHRPLLDAPVLVGVGAAFDFHAGNKPQAPRWMRGACLEWLFRLCSEPKRLWRRYLTIVPAFLLLFGLQALGLRRRARPAGGGANG